MFTQLLVFTYPRKRLDNTNKYMNDYSSYTESANKLPALFAQNSGPEKKKKYR